MSRTLLRRGILLSAALAVAGIAAACAAPPSRGTPTPTKTPRPATVAPSPTLRAVLPTLAPRPSSTPEPTAAPTASAVPVTVPPATAEPSATEAPLTETPRPPEETALPRSTATLAPPTPTPAPQVDFVIDEVRVLGLGENNGGIEAGGLRNIYITVVDAVGNPVDGAVIVNTAPYPGRVTSGDKGPGKAEILMDKEEFRLTVESVGGAATRSETSRTMSLINPVPADIAGKLGDTCPTAEACPLPPYKHFSYVITFRRTY